MMKLGCSQLLVSAHLLCFSAILTLAASPGVPAGQRPGCLDKCGDVDIPFPFGVGDQCALHHGFGLSCNKTADGAMKLFKWNLEVTDVSLPDGKVWVTARTISWRCYNASTGIMEHRNEWLNVTNSPFWISEVDNKIIVIGCNTLAYMMSSSYVIGCYSTCAKDNLENGICSGAGCCQADVPKNIMYYRGYFSQYYNTTSEDRRCSYMVLMQNDAFKFNTSYVESIVFYNRYKGIVPVVLNWQIQPLTCEVARQNMSSYACVDSKSECLDSTNEPGYRCICSPGYEGNPYITDGCKDINECLANSNPCGPVSNLQASSQGDVKSSNILLDGDNGAKVSDFGASILAPTDKSQFVTLVHGTCGYLDPEYLQTNLLTDKSDIYSFGVILLELLTRRMPFNFNLDAPDREKSLLMMFMYAMKENKLGEILDDEIKDEENAEILEEIAELAKQCLEMCGENRPSMKEVAEKLDSLRKVMQHPWVQQNPEEMESLLGEPSSTVTSTIVSGDYFSIEKKAVKSLQSGR